LRRNRGALDAVAHRDPHQWQKKDIEQLELVEQVRGEYQPKCRHDEDRLEHRLCQGYLQARDGGTGKHQQQGRRHHDADEIADPVLRDAPAERDTRQEPGEVQHANEADGEQPGADSDGGQQNRRVTQAFEFRIEAEGAA
jgi:hypothetical protein